MCRSAISIEGLEPVVVPTFVASLLPSERISLFMGDERFFDGPLGKVLRELKGDGRMDFVKELLGPLETDEKKILLESMAFDCLTDDEMFKFQMMVSY